MSALGLQPRKLKSNTLGLTELARLEDLFLSSFEDAVDKGIPDDAAGLKRLRHDLESILTEANKRTKLLAIELTKIYDMVLSPACVRAVRARARKLLPARATGAFAKAPGCWPRRRASQPAAGAEAKWGLLRATESGRTAGCPWPPSPQALTHNTIVEWSKTGRAARSFCFRTIAPAVSHRGCGTDDA
jgi:hypothetical protein